MGEVDIAFRRLLRGLPRPLLRLAFPGRQLEPAGPPLDPSVDRTRQLTTDNLFRVRSSSSGEAIVHVEIERDWRPEIPRRMFGYASAAVTATDLPVWSVVVLLRPGGRPPRKGVHRIPGADGDAFVFRYHVVPLWQLDARQMRAHLGPQGAPFCAAMHGADVALLGELAEEVRTAPSLRKQDRKATMQLLFLVSAAIFGSDAVRSLFHVESLIQDPNVQELIREWQNQGFARGKAEGLARGKAEGLARGKAEGLARGKAEGCSEGQVREARSLLRRVLALRSLPVPRKLQARINGEQDLARLEAWLEAAVTARSLDEVFQARPARPGPRRAPARP